MAETSLKETIYQYCKNPHIRNLFLLLLETASGHDHDGVNSKAVSVGSVGAGLISNTELATDVKVGSLNDLSTTDKDSVVDAINEVVVAVGVASGKVGTLSSLTTTAKSNVVLAINEVVASISGFATVTGAETLTNKTLTTPIIDDTDAGVTLTSADQTNASATVTIPDIGDAADTFCMLDTAQTMTNKTLTTPVVASLYQDAGKTKLMTVPNTASDTLAAIAATQTFTNKTLTTPVIASIYQDAGKTKLMTIPDTASDTLCAIAATQTLTNKTLTAPIVTSPDITLSVVDHDFSGGHADWTLSAEELKNLVVTCQNSDQASNIIGPTTAGRVYIVNNATSSNIVFKTAAGTGVTIATNKTAIVRCNGTNYVRVTGDA